MTVARGIFAWKSTERATGRYGYFYLKPNIADQTWCDDYRCHMDDLRPFKDRRVKILCRVVEVRSSSHVGDLANRTSPTSPEVGEVIDLGVGRLRLRCKNDVNEIGLEPDDKDAKKWIDLTKMYRLFDQTVEVDIIPQ